MVPSVEQIRRMRGGAQGHLMRCDDGGYYVVKFQNNPQHLRILANEMLGTRLAGHMGLPVPRTEVVEVRRDLIELTADLVEAQFAVGAPSAVAPASEGDGALGNLERLAQTLSNAVQLSARKGLLAADLDAELDRLYRDHVEPPRYRRVFEDLTTRNAIRTRANQVFRSTGIWPRLERLIRVAEFTYSGDPLRVDYAYRRNGTRGFVQALPLGRDPAQAKIPAFTAEAIRKKIPKTEFLAVTEVDPRPEDNPRHRFVTGLLEERGISVVPLARLAEWAFQLRPTLLGGSSN